MFNFEGPREAVRYKTEGARGRTADIGQRGTFTKVEREYTQPLRGRTRDMGV